jgi:hypothetical protein
MQRRKKQASNSDGKTAETSEQLMPYEVDLGFELRSNVNCGLRCAGSLWTASPPQPRIGLATLVRRYSAATK